MTEQKWFSLLQYKVFEVHPNNQWLFVHYHFSYSAAQCKFSILIAGYVFLSSTPYNVEHFPTELYV